MKTMSIIKKRAFAFAIDCFVYAAFMVAFQKLLPSVYNWIVIEGSILKIILAFPLCIKDIVFRNASIGKKIFRLAVVNEEMKPPSPVKLMIRAFIMTTVGYILFWKNIILKEDMSSLVSFEKDKLKTMVIEK